MKIKNLKPKNKVQKIARNALMAVVLLFSSLISVLASVLPVFKNNSNVNASSSLIQHSLGNPAALVSGETPDVLYHFPTTTGVGNGAVAPTQAGVSNVRANHWLNKYAAAVKSYQFSEQLRETYWLAAASLTHLNINPTQEDIQNFGDKYSSYFINRSSAFESYQLANEFTGNLSPSTPLSITIPTEVRDVFSIQNEQDPAHPTHTDLNLNDFAYKVAEVDLQKLTNNKSLVFGFQNTAASDTSEHDYRLVFANEDGDIAQLLNNNPGGLTIKDIISDSIVFVRDMKDSVAATAKEPSLQFSEPLRHLTDTLKLTYNSANKTVNVFVVPTNTNDRSTPIKFWYDSKLSDANASGAFKYGILDSTLSPLHTKSFVDVDETIYNPWVYQYANDPIEPSLALIPGDADLVVSTLPIYASRGMWDLEVTNAGPTLANHLRLFMMPNTSLSQKVNFANDKNGSAAFENDQNEFKIAYDNANVLTVTPKAFVVKSYAINAAGAININEPFNVFDKTLTLSVSGANGNVEYKYAQVDIALPSGLLNINPAADSIRHESPYVLPLPTRRIFFEDPHRQGSAEFVDHNKQAIRTEGRVEGLQKNMEILGDIYRNWAGLETQNSNSKTFIRPDTTIFNNSGLPGTTSGYAIFDSTIFDQTRPSSFPDERFAITYKHYLLDANGKVVLDNSKLQDLFQQDPANLRFVLDSNGQKQRLSAEGTAVVNQLVMTSNAYVTWLVNRGNQSTGTAIDEYRLSKPSEASGFVQTRIIDRSGTVGAKMRDVSNALVLDWLGKTLSTDENAKLNELKDELKNRNGASMVPNNFWALISGKGQPTSDPSYETKPEYLLSRQYIYYALQYYMVAAINEVLRLETEKFENAKALYVRTALRGYLTRSSIDVTINGVRFRDPIAPNILVKEATGTGPKFLRVNAYGYSTVASGALEFASLINAIVVLHLDERFLSVNAQTVFRTFIDTVLKPHAPAEWAQAVFGDGVNNEQEISKFLNSLSVILEETIKASSQYRNAGLTSMATIIEKIYNGDAGYNSPDKPIQDLAIVIRATISLISNPNLLEKYVMRGLQIEDDANFLETQVTGYNLKLILQEYLTNNATHPILTPDLKLRIQEFLNLRSYYNNDQVVLFIVHNGYESIRTFVDEITKRPEETARFLIDKPLIVEKSWPLDNNNQIQNDLSNPDNIARYSFIGFGAVAVLIGLAAVGISFGKRGLFGTTAGTVWAIRTIFIAICALGVVLFVIGLVPGIF